MMRHLPFAVIILGAATAGCRGSHRSPERTDDSPTAHRHPQRGWELANVLPRIRFQNPTCAVMPPGRNDTWYVCEREGRVLRVTNERQAADKHLVLDLQAQTLGWGDVGLLNLVFHPRFGQTAAAERGDFFVWYNFTPHPHRGPGHPFHGHESWTRLSRFTLAAETGVADRGSERVLIEQRRTNTDHMGGGMFFHPRDGFLYLAVGDGGTNYVERGDEFDLEPTDDPQRLDSGLLSGVLRIDVDHRAEVSHPIRRQPKGGRTTGYFVPNDNPWLDRSGSVLEEFFAVGLRNPHRMSHDSVTDQIFLGDVGSTVDEINVIIARGNYGWNYREGSRPRRPRPLPLLGIEREPIFAHRGSAFPALIGGYVYRGRADAEVTGKYVFGENGSGQIWSLDPANPGELTELMRLPGEMRAYGGLSSFAVDGQRELYVCILGDNGRGNGSLQKLVPAAIPPSVPASLSAAGLFTDLRSMKRVSTLFAYEINTPFWSDYADKRRWISLPPGARIGFRPQGDWAIPVGTVAIKHFDLMVDERNPTRRLPLETRILRVDAEGVATGYIYRWRPDGQDADIIESPVTEYLTATSARPFYPGAISDSDRWVEGAKSGRVVVNGFVSEAGDFDVAARWREISSESSGFMVRRSASPSASHAALFWENGLLGRRRLIIEVARGGLHTRRVVVAAGPWLRLVREGAQIRFFGGNDGIRWTLLGEANWNSEAAIMGPFARGTPSRISDLARRSRRDHYYPEPGECASCHLKSAGLLLGTNTRQWNRSISTGGGQHTSQLVHASNQGLFDVSISTEQAERLDRLTSVGSVQATLSEQVRSYLDANCSFCHRPGVVSQVVFDARHDTDSRSQQLLWGPVRWPSVPRPHHFIVMPRDAGRSEIYRRVVQRTMPPLGSAMMDRDAAQMLHAWIESL